MAWVRTFAVPFLAATLARSAWAADPPLPPRVFPHPERIRYDDHCLTIEGRDTFVFSGAFHYFRCPEPLWKDRFDKIRAAGFNAVETYVAWNAQEPAEPASVDDFSKVDLSALDRWLSMAEAHGLYVILRPGPYICAEWDAGGFPHWLLPKKPASWTGRYPWLRSDEPSFVAWSAHWFRAVDRVAVPHLLTHRKPGTGGIILYQLENEYGGNQPDDVEVRYLHALGQRALDDGIDVPLFTCWTGVVRGSRDPVLRQAFDSCNFYPGWNVDGIAPRLHKLDAEQPDAPRMTTELQGGWFGNVGHAGTLAADWSSYAGAFTPAQEQNLTLFAIQHGDAITNYYMLFGGTNFGGSAPAGITASYDYSAPIREVGGVGEKYRRVAGLGAMLRDYGPALARSTALPIDAKTGSPDVTVACRQGGDGSLFFFVRTSQHAEPRRGTATITLDAGQGNRHLHELHFDYDLEPFGSRVFHVGPELEPLRGTWLPELPAMVARPAPADLPDVVTITQVQRRDDPGPTDWRPAPAGQSLEQLGVDDCRFAFYRVRPSVGTDGPTTLALSGRRQDAVVARVNGSADLTFDSYQVPGLRAGPNVVELLYENRGQPNGGRGMEEMSGVRAARLATATLPDDIVEWRWHAIPAPADPERAPDVGVDVDTAGWRSTKPQREEDAAQLAKPGWAVFRATLDVPAASVPRALHLSRVDDVGWVFVNGQRVGQTDSWQQPYTFAAPLHAGRNTIAVLVHNTDGSGGVGPAGVGEGPSGASSGLPLEVGLRSTGDANRWFDPATPEAGWVAERVGAPHGGGAMLTWYRTPFDLPKSKSGVWVPWVARLTLAGNGFLYVNGHPLGRYWAVGPQHDFFLPECWLNFGGPNVLTMCLRPTDAAGTGITSAAVVPIAELAERR